MPSQALPAHSFTPLSSSPITTRIPCVTSEALSHLFRHSFCESRNTVLIGGFAEPEYRPANDQDRHNTICFTRDYVSSALHEVAHWCIAGQQRRQQTDFGYWYQPDGRSLHQQQLFEQVEVKPQALEWLFSRACGVRFRISADNLQGGRGPSRGFAENIVQQAKDYCVNGVNADAALWIQVLSEAFATRDVYSAAEYTLEQLA